MVTDDLFIPTRVCDLAGVRVRTGAETRGTRVNGKDTLITVSPPLSRPQHVVS